MKNVLIAIVPGYEAPNAVAHALDAAAARGGALIALAVLDPEAHQRVAKTLANEGFVGERVSDDVVEALEKERRGFAEMQVQQIAEEARRRGLACTAIVEEGDPSEVCTRIARGHDVDLAVLVAERRSWVTRFLSRSAPVRLPTLAGCEVQVMED